MNKTISFNESKYFSRNPLKKYLLNRFINRLIPLILKQEPVSILDAGCGEGFTDQLILKRKPLIKLTGIDISASAIKKAGSRNKLAKYMQGTIYRLPFRNRSFDTVICIEVLEHLQEPKAALLELTRVVNKKAVISVPNEPLFSVLSFFGGQNLLRFGRHPEHINFWNKNSFQDLLNQTGMNVTVKTCGPWLIAEIERN